MAREAEKAAKIRLPSLGRRFTLGQLYDCRSEMLLTGEYLWSPQIVSKFITVDDCKSSSHDVLEDDTLEGKMAALGVGDDRLKVSILGDMVKLSGASKYINDMKNSGNIERAVLKYKYTARKEEMDVETMVSEKILCPNVYAEGTATHVVCGVLYGGQIFFVFDKIRKQHSSISVLDAVKALPNMTFTDDWNIDVPEKQVEEVLNIKCNVHSDFQQPYSPRNYKDALKLYHSLSHVAERQECVKPIEVWLYPLKCLDPLAARMVRDISTELVSEFQATLAHLEQVTNECFDLLYSSTIYKWVGIKTDIEQFRKLLAAYQRYFQGQIGALVSRIRSGSADEDMMKMVMNRKEKSPFAKQQLDIWVKQKYVQLRILKQNDTIGDVSSVGPQSSLIPPHTSLVASDATTSTTPLSLSPLQPDDSKDHSYSLCFHVSTFGGNSLTKLMSTYIKFASDGILKQFSFESLDIPGRKKVSENILNLAKQFKDFIEANQFNQNLKFSYVEDAEETNKPDVYITAWKNGILLHDNYQVPTPPDQAELIEACCDQLQVQWPESSFGRENITGYEVRCKDISGSYKKKVQVTCHEDTVTLADLEIGTQYAVSVRAVCEVGFSQWGPMTSFTTLPGTPPERPNATHQIPDGVSVKWGKPLRVSPSALCKGYRLTIHNVTTGAESQQLIYPTQEEVLLHDLNPTSYYTFSVRALFEEGETEDSEVSQILEPDPNTILKDRLLKDSKIIRNSSPAIHSLDIEERLMKGNGKVRKCELGHIREDRCEKVIMVVGATGAGKTTLINGMVNYALGVRWKDKFRFQLIVDADEAVKRSQAHSQTKWITSYTLHHQEGFRVPYSLTIIDTPGYGDTSGIKRDQETTQQIHKFFTTQGDEGIDHIDAIGFVTQASQARLTPTQRFIFDQVLALFGKDIADNIFLLITFADGHTPPVLDGVKEADIPYKEYFIFNNSALYVENDACEKTSEEASTFVVERFFGVMFWEMGEISFAKFFEGLNKTDAKSLILTKDVLNERQSLEAYVIGVHQHIRSGLNKLEQLSNEVDVLRRHEADIATNKDFTYTVPEEIVKMVNIPSGTYITNCLTCNFTCHYPCSIPDDKDKEGCAAMNSNGVCEVCPAKCEWNVHKNMTYKFEIEIVEKTKTAEELKARYEDASKKKLTAEELVKKVTEELEGVQLKVVSDANEIRKSLDRLREIALRPNPLSTVEYIDILIQTEENKKEIGWKDRRQQLLDIRKHAETLQLLAKPGYDPFEEYKLRFQEMREKGEKEQTIFQSLKTYFKRIF